MSQNDKNVPLIVCDFHTKGGKKDSLGTTKISRSLRLSVHINVINFPEQFELCFYFKYSKSYKVLYKTFKTDFSDNERECKTKVRQSSCLHDMRQTSGNLLPRNLSETSGLRKFQYRIYSLFQMAMCLPLICISDRRELVQTY